MDFQRSRFNRALTSVRLALDSYRHLVTTQHTFIHLRQRASDLLMVCTPGGSIFVSLPLKLVPGCASGSRNLAPHVSGQERGWFRLMESSFEALSSVDACRQFRLVSSSINYQKKTGEKIIQLRIDTFDVEEISDFNWIYLSIYQPWRGTRIE